MGEILARMFEIAGEGYLEKSPGKHGNGAVVYLPKEWIGRKVSVVLHPEYPEQKLLPFCLVDTDAKLGKGFVDGKASEKTEILRMTIPEDMEGAFSGNDANDYIMGKFMSAKGEPLDYIPCTIELHRPKDKGMVKVLWDGSTTEINDSKVYRQNGHPLCLQDGSDLRGGEIVKVFLENGKEASEIFSSKMSFIAIRMHLNKKKA